MTWASDLFTCTPKTFWSSLTVPRRGLAVPLVPTWKSGCAVQGQSETRACKGMAMDREVNFSYCRNQQENNISEG